MPKNFGPTSVGPFFIYSQLTYVFSDIKMVRSRRFLVIVVQSSLLTHHARNDNIGAINSEFRIPNFELNFSVAILVDLWYNKDDNDIMG